MRSLACCGQEEQTARLNELSRTRRDPEPGRCRSAASPGGLLTAGSGWPHGVPTTQFRFACRERRAAERRSARDAALRPPRSTRLGCTVRCGWCLVMSSHEERTQRPGQRRYRRDRPHLERDVDHTAGCRDGVRQLGADGRQLRGHPEPRAAEVVESRGRAVVLAQVHEYRPDRVQKQGRAGEDRQPTTQKAMRVRHATQDASDLHRCATNAGRRRVARASWCHRTTVRHSRVASTPGA
jgi:hypothetical protein